GSMMRTWCCCTATKVLTLRSSCRAVRRPLGWPRHAEDSIAATAVLRYLGPGWARMLASSAIWLLSCCTCRSRGARSSLRLTWYFGGPDRRTCPVGCGVATRPDRLAGRSQGVWTVSSSRVLASVAPGFQRRGGGDPPPPGGGGAPAA